MMERPRPDGPIRVRSRPIGPPAVRLIRFYNCLDRLRKVPSVRSALTTTLIAVYLGAIHAISARRSGWLS